jgi:putative DNA primase/helicase
VVEQVTEFIERHGDSRFSDADAEHAQPVRERAGWWRRRDDERVYLFTAVGMREALRGFDYRRALMHLEQAGMVRKANARGDRQDSLRIAGQRVRVFQVTPMPEGNP